MVKRKWPPGLHKVNGKPKPLRGRHYVYELIKDTSIEKQPNIDVILVSYVDGYGNTGDKVSVKPTVAYNELLLPGLAVYATPENLVKYEQKESEKQKEEEHSSPFAQRVYHNSENKYKNTRKFVLCFLDGECNVANYDINFNE